MGRTGTASRARGTEGEAWILTGDRRERHSRLRGQLERRQRGGRLGRGGWKKQLRRKAGQMGWHPEVILHSAACIPSVGPDFPVPGDRTLNQADTRLLPSHPRTQSLEPRVRRGEPSVRTWARELLPDPEGPRGSVPASTAQAHPADRVGLWSQGTAGEGRPAIVHRASEGGLMFKGRTGRAPPLPCLRKP